MSTALKCDRCKNYFDYDPSAKFNFIAFGHKDIIIGKNFPIKDICPNCMELFLKWFENPDNYDPQDLVKNVNDAKYAFPSPLLKETLEEFGINLSGGEDKWTDEDCDGIGCWECKYFRQDKNIHNPYDEKDAYYCSHKKLYISGNVSRPDYMDMRYTDFDKLGCKEEK